MTMAEIVQHPWIQGPVPTDEQVREDFGQRKAELDQAHEYQKQQEASMFNGGNMAYQTTGTFRDLDEEMMKNLKLDLEFQNLEKNFPNRNNERVLDDYYEEGSSATVHFIRTNIKDLTDFILCVLRQNC